jgi:hypothetical protein
MQRHCADVNSPYKRKCWVHSHAPSIRSHRGIKVDWPDFQPMRVPEEPVCVHLFRQKPVFTSLHLKSPVHVHRLWTNSGGPLTNSLLWARPPPLWPMHSEFRSLDHPPCSFVMPGWTSFKHPTLQMKGRWESNINVWFPFLYSQKWKCYFQNRIIMFCLPSSYTHISFLFFQDQSAYSAAGKYVHQSWEYINRSQTHKCGNWDWGCAIPRKGIHKWDFPCSAAPEFPEIEAAAVFVVGEEALPITIGSLTSSPALSNSTFSYLFFLENCWSCI